MYTRYKFLMLAAFCLVGMVITSFLLGAGGGVSVFSLTMVASFLVFMVTCAFAIHGYSDSADMQSKGYVTGMALDQMASIYAMKRRFLGWELDSHFKLRISAEIQSRVYRNLKETIIPYDRKI